MGYFLRGVNNNTPTKFLEVYKSRSNVYRLQRFELIMYIRSAENPSTFHKILREHRVMYKGQTSSTR
jgi:hypothetical protein